MVQTTNHKEAFEVSSKHGAFYTGGNVEWHDTEHFYCQTSSSVTVLNIEDGSIKKRFGSEKSEDADYMYTFTTDGIRVVTSHKSGLLKLWNESCEVEKIWKCIHQGPIASLVLQGDRLASGGSDGCVRIWDLEHQSCIACLRGCQGVISVVKFLDDQTILASGDDGKINSFDLISNTLTNVYESHYSKVVSIVVPHKENYFVSCGRDKVIIVWQLNNKTPLKIIPTYETIAVIVGLPEKFKLPNYKADPENIYVASAGENGAVRIWDVLHAKEVYSQQNSLVSAAKEEGGLAVTNLLYNKKQKALALITVDHDILIYHLKSFVCLKQFAGYLDQIFDLTLLGENDSHLAVATNSNDIRLYENSTMNCQLLKGHTDVVVSLANSRSKRNLLASSSKDNKIRLWLLNESIVTCVGVGNRHTDSVLSVALSDFSAKFAVSASKDLCIKLWEIPSKFEDHTTLSCTQTEIAHDKEINCITISQNDKLIATASLDKTAKLWTDSLTLIGVLRGHKKGVWSVRFSPIDQVVATSSADCSIKLWSISSLTCLKTIEGNEARVLRVEFLSNGLQLMSTSGDGLIKLFDIKDSECKLTLAEHDEDHALWALAIKSDESEVITGGADSCLIKWKDVTEQKQLERIREEQELIEQEQKLSNYIQSDQLLKALKYALKLDKPNQVLNIIDEIIKKCEAGLSDTIGELSNSQKESLFKCASLWNTNNKNCQVAQTVLRILIEEIQTDKFQPTSFSRSIEGTLPYTDRHYKRLTKLMQDLYLLDYTVHCMHHPRAKVE